MQLVRHNPARILFTGRNKEAATSTIEAAKAVAPDVEVKFIEVDFSALQSVRDAGTAINASVDRLDIVICNAGIMCVPKATTKDGYEIHFAVNHLAHALLMKTLLPTLQRTAKSGSDVRVVLVSSLAFQFGLGIDFAGLRSERSLWVLGGWRRYGESKLANLLYAQQFAAHYPEITTVSIHPGIIKTGLWSDLSLFNSAFIAVTTIGQAITIPEGAKNQLYVATTDKANLVNGGFYEPVGKVGRTNAASRNEKLAKQLWDWTEEQLAPFA